MPQPVHVPHLWRGGSPPAPPQRPAPLWPWLAAASLTALALLVFTARFYWRSEPPRFAVLPFATGADPSLHQVRSELLNELIHQIGSRPPGRLLVTGRDSSMQFAAREPSARQVRDVLRADYVLLGKLRRDGSRLEAVARLIDARRNVQIRSWTVHADLAQTSFDRDIASQLSGKVFELLYPDASHRADLSDQCRGCWEPLRNARTLQAKGTEEGYQRSASLFEEASRIEQRCDRAWSGMAESLVALARRNGDEALLERARRAAQEALRRNPLNAEAMQALANVHLWRDWDWREAERLLRRSLEASPSAATAHQDMAWFLVTSGRRAEAVASVRRAIALDPLSAPINAGAAWIYLQAHEFEESARQARRALELEPGLREAQSCLALALLYQGKHAEAWAAMRPLAPPGFREPRNPTDAIVLLFRQFVATRTRNPYARAVRLAWLGETDAALEAIEEAVRARRPSAVMLRSEPAFVGLWGSPRFRTLMEKAGR